MATFILGNGESRLLYDLDALKHRGKIYGCNAIYRDFSPDVLVAIDPHMVDEIVASGYAAEHSCYFAQDPRGPIIPADCLVGEYGKTQYSGPTAVRLAIKLDKPDKVYLIGFDIVDTKWSNVYAGTPGYDDYRELGKQTAAAGQFVVHNKPTLEQLRDIFIEHPRITFCKVMGTQLIRYNPWNGIPNLVYLTPKQFTKLFKLGKLAR